MQHNISIFKILFIGLRKGSRVLTHIPKRQGKAMTSGQSRKPQCRASHSANDISAIQKYTGRTHTFIYAPPQLHTLPFARVEYDQKSRDVLRLIFRFMWKNCGASFRRHFLYSIRGNHHCPNEKRFLLDRGSYRLAHQNNKILRLIHCLFRGNMQRVPYRP